MIRTIFTPKSNFVSFSIPDRYIGTRLEITVFPVEEISEIKTDEEKKRTERTEILTSHSEAGLIWIKVRKISTPESETAESSEKKTLHCDTIPFRYE
jgi:hypothetical protein